MCTLIQPTCIQHAYLDAACIQPACPSPTFMLMVVAAPVSPSSKRCTCIRPSQDSGVKGSPEPPIAGVACISPSVPAASCRASPAWAGKATASSSRMVQPGLAVKLCTCMSGSLRWYTGAAGTKLDEHTRSKAKTRMRSFGQGKELRKSRVVIPGNQALL